MKGKIIQWNDERGFGFISAKDQKDRVFFHISGVQTSVRRPEVGDFVEFNLGKDANGKLRATAVTISGLSKSNPGRRLPSKVDPPKKNSFDYLLILITISCLGYFAYSFFTDQDIVKIWPYLVPALVSLILLGRSKKPAQEIFTCAKCRTAEKFGPRTISAWSRGTTRLFCKKCHSSWIKEQPREITSYSQGRSGCLGMLLVLALPPAICGAAIYQLFG